MLDPVIRTIVEGEPGIFPDPVARIMRGIGGLFGRKARSDPAAPDAAAPPDDGTSETDGETDRRRPA